MSKEFLCYLIGQQYGTHFEQLAAPFFDYEDLHLAEIIRYSKLSPDDVRSMLVILIKNDIVDYHEKIEAGTLEVRYRINIENVINISMYPRNVSDFRVNKMNPHNPRFLSFMEEKFSILARSLVETLILNGKMTVEDCMLATQDQLLLELGPDAGLEEKDYLNEFGNLVLLNYISAVHKALPLEPNSASDPLSKRKPDTVSKPEIGQQQGSSSAQKKQKKIKSGGNFLLEDSLTAGNIMDL